MENFLFGGNQKGSHPYVVFKEKINLLGKIQEKIASQEKTGVPNFYNINENMQKYNNLVGKIEKKRKIKRLERKADEFETLFEESHIEREDFDYKKRNYLKEKYYRDFIVKLDEVYDPERDNGAELSLLDSSNILLVGKQEKEDPDLEKLRTFNDEKNKRRIYQNSQSFDQLFSLQKAGSSKSIPIQNPSLLEKVLDKTKDTLLSSFIVYYDEIMDLLIDEILEEQVEFLNNLERDAELAEESNSEITEMKDFYNLETKRKEAKSYISPDVYKICNELENFIDI